MLSNILLVVISFSIGWFLSKVVAKKVYAQRMARLLDALGVRREDLQAAIKSIQREDAVDDFATSNKPIESLADLFTIITITREGDKLYAYEGERFVGQADSVAELHDYIRPKFSAVAYVTEDDAISDELATIDGVSDDIVER